MKYFLSLLSAVVLFSCNNSPKDDTQPYVKERASVNSNPVAVYEEPVNDKLNPDWKFKVQLFEQKESLKFEAKFQYKEVTGEKIFSVPNLGFMPKPALKKGPQPFSCIIGFYDADSTFMELRMVRVENENLVYSHLKEYAVEKEKE